MSKLRKWMMKEERDTSSCGSGDLSSSAIKLFGKTIAVSGGADSASVSASVSTKAGSEEVDGASTQLEGENLGSSPGSVCNETESKDADVVNEDYVVVVAAPEVAPEVVTATLVVESSSPLPQPVSEESNLTTQQPEKVPQRALTQEEKKEQCLKKPDKLIPCPRCESVDTKFCYYNNYNINQPRHFCKSCQRYWTAGGTLRNVLVGAGRRKNKYGVAQSRQDGSGAENLTAVRMDHHESAQQSFPSPAVMNSYTLGTVPPMNLPRHGVTHSPHNNNNNHNNVVSDSQPGSTITTNTMHGLGSAFKPLGPEISSDSVSKLRQRTQTTTTTTTTTTASDVKADCATSGETTPNTYVLTPRATPDASQAVWTKSNAAPLGFFNGAWPYGYNIGWSGAGPIPGAGSATPSPVWTGMWASAAAAPVPTFGWNMLQGAWTLPWRPVPAVGVQMQVATATTPTSRKREGSDADVVPSRAKIARVGAPGEEVVAV